MPKKKQPTQSPLFPVKKKRYIPKKGVVTVTRIAEGTPPKEREAILKSLKYFQ